MSVAEFIIVRKDLVQDPVTIIAEGLLIGRLVNCELQLNHPSVSRVQAGFRFIDESYYVFNLRPSNPAILNDKAVEGNQALAAGDVLRIGPFDLEIDTEDGALLVKVSLRIGMAASELDFSSPELTTSKLLEPGETKPPPKARPAPIAGNKALDIFWDKRIRDAGKMVRPSPLFPRSQKRQGKAQFTWTPTSDLAGRWPVSFFFWAAAAVAVLSAVAAFSYASAYAPAPVSSAHSRALFSRLPAIALRPNNNSCTSCHSFSASMDSRCSSCHQTEIFAATITKDHAAARIGCASCHAEHKGAEFEPRLGALQSCVDCHNDANSETYNGQKVGTAHGGRLGYPVVDEKWVWQALDNDDWLARGIAVSRLPEESDEQWRSKQFHALHVRRVVSVAGLPADDDGRLSCSSCHRKFDPIDRDTPRTTCSACHNGKVEPGTNRVLIANNKPNCTSCHVQHAKDTRHWNSLLLPKP